MKFSFHTDPRFIHMFHWRLSDHTSHGPGKALIGIGAPRDPVDDRPLGQVYTKEIPDGLDQPFRRNQLIGAQIDRETGQMGTILHRSLYAFRKGRRCCLLTARTDMSFAQCDRSRPGVTAPEDPAPDGSPVPPTGDR